MVGKLNDIKPISLIRSHYRIITKHLPIKLMEVDYSILEEGGEGRGVLGVGVA